MKAARIFQYELSISGKQESPLVYPRPDVIRRVVDSGCEEVADHCRDLLRMSLKREVTGVEEMDFGIGNIAHECVSATRQEKRIILSPHRQEPRLVRPEVVLERRVQRHVVLVVAEQVQLDLVGAGAGQIEVVE